MMMEAAGMDYKLEPEPAAKMQTVVIPKKLWKEEWSYFPSHFSDSDFLPVLGTTSGMLSTEDEIVSCPYNPSHLIPRKNMSKHMMQKCRWNYRQKVIGNGGEPKLMTCRYNMDHQVLGPELWYHEDNCPDRFKVPTYLAVLNQINMEEEEVATSRSKKLAKHRTKLSQADLDEMYEGFHIYKVTGGWNPFGEPVSFEEVDDPDWRRKRTDANVLMAKEKAELLAVAATTEVPEGNPQVTNEEPEEVWGEGPNVREEPFDYMKRIYNPIKPILKYPPGLTKSQRREYCNWNADWISRIRQREAEIEEFERMKNAEAEENRDEVGEPEAGYPYPYHYRYNFKDAGYDTEPTSDFDEESYYTTSEN